MTTGNVRSVGSRPGAKSIPDTSSGRLGSGPDAEAGLTCPICGASRPRYSFSKDSYPVYFCAGCGCEFLEPQPDDAELAEIYDAEYFLGDHDEASDQRVAALKSASAALYLDRLATVLNGTGKRLLEIGCGTGDFLLAAQSRSLEVNGVEFSPVSVVTANRRLGAELVQQGTIENASFPRQHFDVIAACDVIEHTRSPKEFLARAYSLLRPGGVIFLVTPSLDSLSRKLLGNRWMEYKVEHLFYFGQKSLARLLIDAGFEPPAFAPNRKALSLDYVYRHFERFPVPVITPLLGLVRRCATEGLAQRQWVVPASGVFATAKKPVSAKGD
jgi:2-polyprenyl-3-methyl-5-hydroxy-6-metoxy-1,4-benzoquinol methylase